MVDRLWRAVSMVFSGRVNISFTHACMIKNSSSDVSALTHLQASPTCALLHCCLPTNLLTTTQGAIAKLHRASPELCILNDISVGTVKVRERMNLSLKHLTPALWLSNI